MAGRARAVRVAGEVVQLCVTLDAMSTTEVLFVVPRTNPRMLNTTSTVWGHSKLWEVLREARERGASEESSVGEGVEASLLRELYEGEEVKEGMLSPSSVSSPCAATAGELEK